MMKRFFHILSFCAAFGAYEARAQLDQTGLILETAAEHIDITVGFSGAHMELFGNRLDKDAEVVVMVEGPRKDVTVWKKQRVLGAWVNWNYVSYEGLPSYYQYAVVGEGPGAQTAQIMFDNEVGFKGMFEATKIDASVSGDARAPFRQALLNDKKGDGVYFENTAQIKFLSDQFFRLKFYIPPSAPTGEYKIHSFLMKEGRLLEHDIDRFDVRQVGLNASISSFAHQHSVFYALGCIILALFSGWLGSALRVKP